MKGIAAMRHHIRAVLFDLDGVVANTTPYHYQAWKRVADEHGWDLPEQMAEAMAGMPRLECLQTILQLNGVDMPVAQRQAVGSRKNAYLVESLIRASQSDLRPGVTSFLSALRQREVKLALYSLSSSAAIVAERLGLSRWFDVVVTGSDISHADWAGGIFEACARRLRVPAFHCISVETSPRGVKAALAAKLKVLGIGEAARHAGARECVDHFSDINIDFMLDSSRVERFPEEEWRLSETGVVPGRSRYWETLFALTNGYMGVRGTHDEEDPVFDPHSYPGMFLNGIYGHQPYHHVVEFTGFPKRLHVMLNLADWRIINLSVDAERFSLFTGTISEYRRSLDMRRGVLERSLVWTSPEGRKVRIRSTRVVSMARRHSAAIRFEVTPLDKAASLVFESRVHASVNSEELGAGQTRVSASAVDDAGLGLHVRATTADFDIGMAFTHRVNGGKVISAGDFGRQSDTFSCSWEVLARKGETVSFDKHAAFYTSVESPAAEVVERARKEVASASQDGFAALLERHEAFWRDYWQVGDVEIEGSAADQQAMRFNLFHLRQANPEDDRRSIGANAITGDKYRGHVFWDTEMYLVPHYLYTQPQTVRPLLMYRYNILDRARERARQMGGVGALYSWNSISGEECGVVFEASTAEYHLLSAIAYAIWRYTDATADRDFLFHYGAEMLFETARFLQNRGAYIPHKGNQFCINVVCGPDEYGCGVNNNCYTNVMVQWHLRFAESVYARMKVEAPEELDALAGRIDLRADEVAGWTMAADRMYIPFNKQLGIHEQDDSFLSLDPVDMAMVPRNTDIRDTMHPLNLWRVQVAKQADVVLLMFAQGHQFGREVKKANYEFYEARTCHGSSLSACMHSIVATEVGKHAEAYDYFRESANMDLNDFKDNTGGGIHAACLGGTWMAVVNGFGGLRDYPDGLRLAPVLPASWKSYRFTVLYRGSRIRVTVKSTEATYELLEGPGAKFESSSGTVELSSAQPVAQSPLAA